MKTTLTSNGLNSKAAVDGHLEIEADKISVKEIVCGSMNIVLFLKQLEKKVNSFESEVEFSRKENERLNSLVVSLKEDVSKLEKQLKDKPQNNSKQSKEEKDKA